MSAVRSFAISDSWRWWVLGLGAATSHARHRRSRRAPASERRRPWHAPRLRRAPSSASSRRTPCGRSTRSGNWTKRYESSRRHRSTYSADPKYAERAWASGNSKGKSPARDTVFRRDIWSLEFSFKPVRFVPRRRADARRPHAGQASLVPGLQHQEHQRQAGHVCSLLRAGQQRRAARSTPAA